MLKRGDKGSQVVEVQKMLKQLGYLKDKVDGVFGSNTENAVKAFQRVKQVKIDGIVGPVTYGLLKQAYQQALKQQQAKLPANTILTPIIKPAPKKVKGTPIKKADIKYIVIHHSASSKPLTWEQIDAEHKRKGWSGFGYHFLVDPDGTITAGRALNIETIVETNTIAAGAQAKGMNLQSIGICFNGNFEEEEPTPEQITAGKQLVRWLKYKILNKPQTIGHKEVVKIVPGATITACPGRNFPLDAFKSL